MATIIERERALGVDLAAKPRLINVKPEDRKMPAQEYFKRWAAIDKEYNASLYEAGGLGTAVSGLLTRASCRSRWNALNAEYSGASAKAPPPKLPPPPPPKKVVPLKVWVSPSDQERYNRAESRVGNRPALWVNVEDEKRHTQIHYFHNMASYEGFKAELQASKDQSFENATRLALKHGGH
ncbi:MAG: hypothetical protein IT381_33345 [Deltaproteobacteria bacterium]|nr:hypothetical protein [Deltaproteobacteria bacterium]